MIEGWRWYGQYDPISLPEIRQTGARVIITALHEVPYGEVWPRELVSARRAEVEKAGFKWAVVESLPVDERIKRGEGGLAPLFANYRQSLANLAAEGVKTVCYNFMPLLDWTRTDLKAPNGTGGTCLRFSAVKMAAFEIHMLHRESAAQAYLPEVVEAAAVWFQQASDDERTRLLNAIMSGLPGAFERYDVDGLRNALTVYAGMDHPTLRSNYKRFLDEVIPTAEDLGMRLCVHPDDPPHDILGLPRIVSNSEDIAWVIAAVDSPANGVTLCSGSLGANPENDVPAIAESCAGRIHFAHLRNVKKFPDGSFEEAAHLEGDTDMVALIDVLLKEETARIQAGRLDAAIVFRPDHGHEILTDSLREYVPGYPMIGRLRGLSELRGVIRGRTYPGV